jgi:hypothetical protein
MSVLIWLVVLPHPKDCYFAPNICSLLPSAHLKETRSGGSASRALRASGAGGHPCPASDAERQPHDDPLASRQSGAVAHAQQHLTLRIVVAVEPQAHGLCGSSSPARRSGRADDCRVRAARRDARALAVLAGPRHARQQNCNANQNCNQRFHQSFSFKGARARRIRVTTIASCMGSSRGNSGPV